MAVDGLNHLTEIVGILMSCVVDFEHKKCQIPITKKKKKKKNIK